MLLDLLNFLLLSGINEVNPYFLAAVILIVILIRLFAGDSKDKNVEVAKPSFGPMVDGYKFKSLPKWFNGEIYESGQYVTREFTGEKVYLNPFELSMYDFLKGFEIRDELSVETLAEIDSLLTKKKVTEYMLLGIKFLIDIEIMDIFIIIQIRF